MKILFYDAQWSTIGETDWLMLKTDLRDAMKFCLDMKPDTVYEADLKEHRKRRSLDANAYAWVLIGKLAAKLNLPKEDVYRQFIKDVGNNYEILPIRDDAVEKWISNWQGKGIGWVCDILGESKLEGYTNVITYYGSSTYDSKQMSDFIKLVTHECESQGIETMTPQELSLLMGGWNGK